MGKDTKDPAADVDGGDEADSLRQLIREELGGLLGSGDVHVHDDGDAADDDDKGGGAVLPPSPRQVEADTESMVRRLIGEAENDREHRRQHGELAETVKKLAETPPAQVRRITRWMGFGD